MIDLAALLHEISVAFGCSTNTGTLPVRLADGMGRHLQIAEIESMRLDRRREVRISAYAPGILRRWEGQRTIRFLDQQRVLAPTFVTDELARVAIAPIATKLKLPIGRMGLLSIAFETDIWLDLGAENTEILVDVLALHCLRLGQLTATALRCHEAHHRRDTEKPVNGSQPPITEKPAFKEVTEISVSSLDSALVHCICAALSQTRGKIYGEDGAATLLGLKPSTLQSKMRKLGIERTPFTRISR